MSILTKVRKWFLRFDPLGSLSAFSGVFLVVLIAVFIAVLLYHSAPVFEKFGLNFITGGTWNPMKDIYGALPFIWGTFITSAIAIVLAVVLSYGAAYFIVEIAPLKLREFLSSIVELIVAIPSVIIGLWGMFYVVPFVRDTLKSILSPLSSIPLFGGTTSGYSYMAAIIVLTFMITPISTSFIKNAMESVPIELKEAAYALGATKYEVFRIVSRPLARRSALAGVVLAYGRAIGETMAVVMVIGNSPTISISLFNPGYTLAAVIANEFLEATTTLHVSALIALGTILLAWSLIVNILAAFVLRLVRAQ